MTCEYCDPEFYVVYGYCLCCGRLCNPPLVNFHEDTKIYKKIIIGEILKIERSKKSCLVCVGLNHLKNQKK